MTVTVVLSSIPPDTSITIQSHTLVVTTGSGAIEIHLAPAMPNLSLAAGTAYTFSLAGQSVEVTASV